MWNNFKHWRTTLVGISAVIGGVILIIDGKIVEGISAISAGVVGIFAKDANAKP